jgi:hypothetical protein
MIHVAQTSRGLIAFAVPGGWGDWYEVVLFDEQLNQLASDEEELHEERDVSASLIAIGLPEDEARSLAGQLVPEPLT